MLGTTIEFGGGGLALRLFQDRLGHLLDEQRDTVSLLNDTVAQRRRQELLRSDLIGEHLGMLAVKPSQRQKTSH